MTDVEFICHTKQLDTLCRSADGRILAVPLRLPSILRDLLRRRGLRGLVAALTGQGTTVDLHALVDRNLKRREIRLPQVFTVTPVRAVYSFFLLLRARLQAALITSYLEQYPRAKALIFNGYLMPDSITAAMSEAQRRETLVLENGFFPGTSQADTAGINFDSTLPRDPAFYAWVSRLIAGERPRELVSRPSKQKAVGLVQPPPRYIFVPMQVPSDMQILKHSPWILDMKHFYEVIYRLAERMPECSFVIKEHPSFPLSIQPHIQRHARIHFANHNETKALIEGADAVDGQLDRGPRGACPRQESRHPRKRTLQHRRHGPAGTQRGGTPRGNGKPCKLVARHGSCRRLHSVRAQHLSGGRRRPQR